MNTGIQDAYNLAWKLAIVERGIADETLLDSYHAERQPIGVRLLKTTDDTAPGAVMQGKRRSLRSTWIHRLLRCIRLVDGR